METNRKVSRRSFLAAVTGGAAASAALGIAHDFAAAQPASAGPRQPTGITNRDPNDPVGHGRTGITDGDPSDAPCGRRGCGRRRRRRGCGSRAADSDPRDRAGSGRSARTDSDPMDRPGCGERP